MPQYNHSKNPSSGYVYVLKNPAMPDIVKIGMSRRGAKERAKELYTTGVPEQFCLVFEVFVDSPSRVEAFAHKYLDAFRANEGREFFKVDDSMAVEAVLRGLSESHEFSVHNCYEIDYETAHNGFCPLCERGLS
jgi:hypothetical protein